MSAAERYADELIRRIGHETALRVAEVIQRRQNKPSPRPIDHEAAARRRDARNRELRRLQDAVRGTTPETWKSGAA